MEVDYDINNIELDKLCLEELRLLIIKCASELKSRASSTERPVVSSNIRKSGRGNKYNAWTEEEEEKLRELYADKTIKEISEIIGRTANAIKVKAYNLQLTGKYKSKGRPKIELDEEVIDEILALRALGRSARKIQYIIEDHHNIKMSPFKILCIIKENKVMTKEEAKVFLEEEIPEEKEETSEEKELRLIEEACSLDLGKGTPKDPDDKLERMEPDDENEIEDDD